MSKYDVPKLRKPAKVGKKQVLLVASGDMRLSANQACWPKQQEMEDALTTALAAEGYELIRAHPYDPETQHGFISSQKQGMAVFANIDPSAKLIVAESAWQYSYHILPGLLSHRGPILTVANWSGTWPGLVGMLNLNGSLTKAGKKYATLWSEDFTDKMFVSGLKRWLAKGKLKHPTKHVEPIKQVKISSAERKLGQALAAQLDQEKAIMGIFDEGCMGMYNAIIDDEIL
ncbi:MAG: fucose isomerase, partial [Thermoguttaceae bacterium]